MGLAVGQPLWAEAGWMANAVASKAVPVANDLRIRVRRCMECLLGLGGWEIGVVGEKAFFKNAAVRQ
jgi:hypothetical protein